MLPRRCGVTQFCLHVRWFGRRWGDVVHQGSCDPCPFAIVDPTTNRATGRDRLRLCAFLRSLLAAHPASPDHLALVVVEETIRPVSRIAQVKPTKGPFGLGNLGVQSCSPLVHCRARPAPGPQCGRPVKIFEHVGRPLTARPGAREHRCGSSVTPGSAGGGSGPTGASRSRQPLPGRRPSRRYWC